MRRRLTSIAALGVVASLAAVSCGGDDDTTTPAETTSATETTSASTSIEATTPTSAASGDTTPTTEAGAADPALSPVKVGFISQENELVAFPEMSAGASAAEAYINAELAGVDGHPLQVEVCTTGDTPESAVACAQQFVNDDDTKLVIVGTFNSAPAWQVLIEGGKPVFTLANDLGDQLTPGVVAFDPGSLALATAIDEFAAVDLGLTSAAVLYVDDPTYEKDILPVVVAVGESFGFDMSNTVPVGIGGDATAPVTAALGSDPESIGAIVDTSQCAAVGAALDSLGSEVPVFSSDLCATQAIIESGALEGWYMPVASDILVSPEDGGDAELDRIISTYGSNDVRAGLGGWALGNVIIARDVLTQAGGADATSESILAVLDGYSNDGVPGLAPASCPGPGSLVGGCLLSPMIIQIVDGKAVVARDFAEIDTTTIEALLAG